MATLIPTMGLFFVLLYAVKPKFVKMKAVMIQPPSGENGFAITTGLICYIFTYIGLKVFAVFPLSMPLWIPTILQVVGAVLGGFGGMWGKDLYKSWKAKKTAKKATDTTPE